MTVRPSLETVEFPELGALLAGSMDKVRAAPIDVSKTYTNEFVRGR